MWSIPNCKNFGAMFWKFRIASSRIWKLLWDWQCFSSTSFFWEMQLSKVRYLELSEVQMPRSGGRRRPILLPFLLGPLSDLDPALFFLPEKFKGSLLFGFRMVRYFNFQYTATDIVRNESNRFSQNVVRRRHAKNWKNYDFFINASIFYLYIRKL